MNNPLFNLNQTQPGTIASSVTVPNALNKKKRKFAGNIGGILNLANAPQYQALRITPHVAPNRNIAVPQVQRVQQQVPEAVQQQIPQAPGVTTQFNPQLNSVSQLQGSPQGFLSFLNQFNTR